MGSSCVIDSISVASALLPSFWCASRPVIPAFVLFLLRFAPHLVLGFPTGLYPVGFEGRIHYTWWISWGQGQALPDQSGRPCVVLLRWTSSLCFTLGCDCCCDFLTGFSHGGVGLPSLCTARGG